MEDAEGFQEERPLRPNAEGYGGRQERGLLAGVVRAIETGEESWKLTAREGVWKGCNRGAIKPLKEIKRKNHNQLRFLEI